MFLGALIGGLGAGLASAATGAISSGINAGISRVQSKKQLEQQMALNEQAFEKNKQLAELQNQFNIEQWERENAYNTPLEQAKRLIEAGLNPDLVIKGLGGQAADSPALVAGTPFTSPNVAEISNAAVNRANAITNAFNQTAQTSSNVKQQDVGTSYFLSVQNFRRQIEEGQVKLQGITIDLRGVQKDLTAKQIESLSKNMAKVDQDITESKQRIEESKAKISLMSEEQKIKKVEAQFAKEFWQKKLSKIGAEIRKLGNEADFVGIQNEHIGQWYILRNLNIQQDTNTSNALEKYWDSNSDNLDIKTTLEKLYGASEKEVNIALAKAKTIQAICEAASSFIRALTAPIK